MLVVLLVIGVLGLVSGVAVFSARERVRDTARLAHVREIQDGLESYFIDHSAYPVAQTQIALGKSATLCLSNEGFSCTIAPDDAYLDVVPSAPTTGLKGESSCDGIANAYCYQGGDDAYGLQFELERAHSTLGLVKGVNCATETKFVPGPCVLRE